MGWGQARRPKVSTKLGNPSPREGSDGDIQIKGTALGAKLWGKWSGRWWDVPLSKDGITKFGVTDSDYLSIDRDSIDIYKNKLKVAEFGSDVILGGTGSVTVGSHATTKIVLDSSAGTLVVGSKFDIDSSGNVSVEDISLSGKVLYGASVNLMLGSSQVGTGTYNVGIGYKACGDARENGSNYNVGISHSSLGDLTTGDDNVALGRYSGWAVTTGSNNIFLGHDAGRTGSPGGNITTADDTLVIGDENMGASHIQTDWTVASDKRDKTDVSNLSLGLEFVNKLTPVTYKWDKRSKYIDKDDASVDLNAVTTDGTHKEDWLDIGFLAQDVETIENSYGHKVSDKTNLTFSISGDGKQYGTQYTKFIPILTKAVQELSAKIDTMQTEINNLKT